MRRRTKHFFEVSYPTEYGNDYITEESLLTLINDYLYADSEEEIRVRDVSRDVDMLQNMEILVKTLMTDIWLGLTDDYSYHKKLELIDEIGRMIREL